MQRKFRIAASAAMIFAVTVLLFGSTSPVRAESCDSEESATEECFLDGPTAEGLGVAPGSTQGSPPSANADARAASSPVAPSAIVPAPRPSLRIWTDRPRYQVGDDMKVCYRVPAPGRIQIIDLMPDGSRHILWSKYEDGRGDCMAAWVTPPTGKECLVLRWASSWSDDRRYIVPQASGAAEIVPAIAPAPPKFFYAKTCFQTWGDWDWGWDSWNSWN